MGLFATNKQNKKTTKTFLVKKELSRLKYNTVQLLIVYCSTLLGGLLHSVGGGIGQGWSTMAGVELTGVGLAGVQVGEGQGRVQYNRLEFDKIWCRHPVMISDI